MAKPERGKARTSMLPFLLGLSELWGGRFLRSMIHFRFIDGEIWYGNGLFIWKYQMTDAKTWGNVVGKEIRVILGCVSSHVGGGKFWG